MLHYPLSGCRSGSMKAQTLVFERVLLFFIGVIIFVVCFAVFTNYQDYFLGIGTDDQLEDVGNYISYNILRLAEKGAGEEAEIKVSIPPMIGNEQYTVILTNAGLEIITAKTEKNIFLKLYGLNETFEFGGERVISSRGEFLIYKKQNRIILI